MLFILSTFALGATQVLANDQAAVDWIRKNDFINHTQLPVVGPYTMRRFESEVHGDVWFTHITPSEDPEVAAINARLDRGSPCALLLAPLEQGWVGWTSGACGMLSLGGWRWENQHVLNSAGNPVTVRAFASSFGDTTTLRHYQKLDQARSRAIWIGLVGSGLFFAGTIDTIDQESNPTGRILQVTGGAMTITGIAMFVKVQSQPRSHQFRIDAYYDDDEIKQRIRAHNHRLRLAWSPTGVSGTFF